MCLIVFAWDVHPKYKLVLAANRDEFYERPTAKAAFWQDHPSLLGGRDLKAGGTWMAISKSGRFSAVTNYRDLKNIKPEASSRGELPVGFLLGGMGPRAYLKALDVRADQYNGFNILVGDLNELAHYSNYERKVNVLRPGVYALSNALLDTSWPKVERSRQLFSAHITGDFKHSELLDLMCDPLVAPDNELPDTGLSYELEKALSAMCIRTESYGTCCTSVITIEREKKIEFSERTYPVGNRVEETVSFQMRIDQ